MRQGWVFWYVGSPVMSADEEDERRRRQFVFSAAAAAAGKGVKFIECTVGEGADARHDERSWPRDGLPDDDDDDDAADTTLRCGLFS